MDKEYNEIFEKMDEMHDKKIMPTNTCFDDIREILDTLISLGNVEEGGHRPWRICHGIIRCSFKRNKVSHAWVENIEKNLCYKIGIIKGERFLLEMDRSKYYKNSKASEVTRYDFIEMKEIQNKTVYSPYKKKYLDLCRSKDKHAYSEVKEFENYGKTEYIN